MGKRRKTSPQLRRPRVSKALNRLRDKLGLDQADWLVFLKLAREGFSEWEHAQGLQYDEPLDLEEVPDEWVQDLHAIGFVTLHVLGGGHATLTGPVVEFFLGVCDPDPEAIDSPPGIGAAWLHAVKMGLPVPVDAGRLAFLAMQSSRTFLQGIEEADLPTLSRLILEAKGPPEAWDLHVLLVAVDRARIHVRAPFRLFHSLMSADWLVTEVKREFCRGLLGCSPQAERFRQRDAALREMLESTEDWWGRLPLLALEVARYGPQRMLPGLQRHAVLALVEHVGEPAREVIDEFLLSPDRLGLESAIVRQGALDVVNACTEELGPDATRRYLDQGISDRAAPVRHAAYRIGLKEFGPAYVRSATEDPAASVRKWATKALASSGSGKARPQG